MGFFAISGTIEGDALAESSAKWLYTSFTGVSLILALGNGTVEAFINPVVATIFDKDKTKWLNILHAGWPGGLVVAGDPHDRFMASTARSWGLEHQVLATIVAIPAVDLTSLCWSECEFPSSGACCRQALAIKDMLCRIWYPRSRRRGFLGLTLGNLMKFFPDGQQNTFHLYWRRHGCLCSVRTQRVFGRPTDGVVLILIMMPLATTEIGTDGWITGIMQGPSQRIKFQRRLGAWSIHLQS